MERRRINLFMACATLLLSALSSRAEKIQFSTPSQPSKVITEDRSQPKSSPNLFDKFRNGGADAFNMPIPAPQTRAPNRNPDDKKDWLATPEDQAPSVENMFSRKGSDSKQSSTSLARIVQDVERNEAALKNLRDKSNEEPTQDFSSGIKNLNKHSLQSSFANPNFNLEADKLGKQNFSYSDYWKETTGLNPERYEEQATLRRAEFQQIFDNRNALEQLNSLTDTTRQPVNPFTPAPTDFSGRTSQSSVSDAYQNGYSPLTGTRSSVLDDVNSRSLGRDSSSSLNTRLESPRIQAQPAMLPFPTRPGELFKRPGSF